VAIQRIKSILEDGETKELEYLIAHIEALIPTSEAIRDYLHMAQGNPKFKNVEPSDPSIPYRSRRWRARQLIRNIIRNGPYERICTKVRKVPSQETSTQQDQQHNNTKAGKDNGSE
jgi:hypothetical protein